MQRRKGFTLVELVVVIAVIAILAGVLIGTFASVINKANASAKAQEIKQQEIEQKATDILKKLEESNWLGWEDFETSIVAKITQEIKNNGAALTADQVKKIIEDALTTWQANKQAGNTELTAEQVKAIVENAVGTLHYEGVTEAQVRAIVKASESSISAQLLTPATIKQIVNAANEKNLTAAQVARVVADTSNTSVNAIITALNTTAEGLATSVQVETLRDEIKGLAVSETDDVVVAKALNIKLKKSGLTTTTAVHPTVVFETIQVTPTLKMGASDANDIMWDSANNSFVVVRLSDAKYVYSENAATETAVVDKYKLWKVVNSIDSACLYSQYLLVTTASEPITVVAGLDVGKNTGITAINYTRTTGDAQTVVIRTNGGTLTVNAPLDTVKHYGDADSVNIVSIANASYHENGKVPFIQISKGRIEIEADGDVNGIHVANVQVVDSEGNITKTANTFTGDVVLTLNGNVVKLTRDTIGTEIATPVLVCEVQANANSDEYIWLVGDGTIENAKVYVTNTNETPDTTVASTTTPNNASDAAIAIANNATNTGTEEAPNYVAVEAGTSAENAQAASALKGSGTEADPFLVYDYATMQKISDFYYKGYYYFTVALDKTDNGKIDCTGWTGVNLYGSFDGKGVTFTGLDATLFDTAWNSVLGNFTVKNAKVRQSSGAIVLYQCHKSIIDNVVVEGGYVEGSDRSAIFVGWGDASDNNTIEIKNCHSNATVVCGNSESAAFVGHPYSNDGAHETSVIIDNCYFNGKIYNKDDTSPYLIAQSDNTVKVYLRNMSNLESYYGVKNGNNWIQGMSGFDNNQTHVDANNETYYTQTNYSVKYLGEHGKISVKTISCSQNKGELVSISGSNVSSSASYAKIEFLVAPNAAATESGSYQSVYALEENVEVVNGTVSASRIFNCDIQINGTSTSSTGYNSNNTIFNIINQYYGKTHNGATAKFTEYDSNGNIVQIVNVTIATSNSVGVMYNGASIKNAAVGCDYEFDTGLDLSNYDVKVVFVDRDSSWNYNFNYYAEFNGTNVADSTIQTNYATSSTFEVIGSKVVIHGIERKPDRYDYGSLRYGIIVTEKSN